MKILFVAVFCCLFVFAETNLTKEEMAIKQLQSQTHLDYQAKMQKESNLTFPFAMAQSPLESVNKFQYLGVIFVLASLLIFLWYFKKRAKGRGFVMGNKAGIKILYEANLNLNTKIVIVQIRKMCYVLAINSNNVVLLDKYQDFEECLKQESER
ncbi:flagellar biosynthetic protein FliO [Helicobacter burdigaliensis]|uniref:flagellar biosynthetic protein FliO n=1 Tax=Helicobacter burdigaliensis TaxID=2315334 RepID=UPI000EF6A17D|nr:flagellar biosynthetic protein FliO [Helicobacter burdigaliensis]